MANDLAGRTHGGQMAPGHGRWQVEGGAAERYQRYLVPAVTAGWAAGLVDRAGAAVSVSLMSRAAPGWWPGVAAARVGRAGRVAGVDINAAVLGVARSLPADPGARVGWVRGRVLSLPGAEARHDVVACRLGLQVVRDRRAALAQMRRVLIPGGRLGVGMCGPIGRNPATFALARALGRHLGGMVR